MSNEPQKNEYSENHHLFKADIFDKYKFWKSLPFLWKKMTQDELKNKFGIDDDYTLEMLSLKTQSEFAQKHGIAVETTSDWNKRIEEKGNEYEEQINKWASKLTKNVFMAHYNKLIRKFDPVSAELWYKRVDKWNDKQLVEVSGQLSILDLAKKVADEQGNNKQD